MQRFLGKLFSTSALLFVLLMWPMTWVSAMQSPPTTVSVTGHFTNKDGSPAVGLSVRFRLGNCATGIPRVINLGTVISDEVSFNTDASGNVNGAIWSNDVLDCGGVTGQSRWLVTQVVNNIPQTTPICYNVLAQNGLNLNTATPCPQMNPPTPPGQANDGTFMNLNILGKAIIHQPVFSLNGPNFSVQYQGSDGGLYGDNTARTDGSGNFSFKTVDGTGYAKAFRTSSSTTDGCQNAFNSAVYNCVIESGVTDGGVLTNSTHPVAHTQDRTYGGATEMYQNTVAPTSATIESFSPLKVYSFDDKIVPLHAGAYDSRPTGEWTNYFFSGRGRDTNAGAVSQWSSGAGRVSNMYVVGAGIHQRESSTIQCYSIGDCMDSYRYLYYQGGVVEGSGEGVRGIAQHVLELNFTPQGTVATTAIPGATTVSFNVSTGNGTVGVGHYLVNKKTKTYSGTISTVLSDGSSGLLRLTSTDANFAPSPWIGQGTLTTSINPATTPDNPALVSFIVNTVSGDSSNLSVGDHVCFASVNSSGGEELTIQSVSVSGSAVTLGLNPKRGAGTYVTVAKGACQALDAANMRLFNSNDGSPMNALMIVGYLNNTTALLGFWQQGSMQQTYGTILANTARTCTATLSQNGTLVSAALQGNGCVKYFANNPYTVVSGTTDFNGTVPSTPYFNGSLNSATINWTATSSATIGNEAGTLAVSNLSAAFNVYPMAIIKNVCNGSVTTPPTAFNATPCLTGIIDLETNSVAWNSGDPFEVPHTNAIRSNGLFLNLSQYTPGNGNTDAISIIAAGAGYAGVPLIDLNVGIGDYQGSGGRLLNPPVAMRLRGPNYGTIETSAPTVAPAGVGAVISIHCNQISYYANGFSCPQTPEYAVLSNQWNNGGAYSTLYYQPLTQNLRFSGYNIFSDKVISSTVNGGGFNAPLYTPPSSSATCTTGTVAWDANYYYVCVATNTWKRSALTTF